METLGIADIKAIVGRIAAIMTDRKDELTKLDGAMGDGDLGLTMEKAFTAARDEAAALDEADAGKLLQKLGMVMARTAPSTMGTLAATGFMSGGKAVVGLSSLGPKEVAAFFQAFVAGIMQRGKSKPGEKTIVDVLFPAAEAISEAVDSGGGLAEAFRACRAAAAQGRVDAQGMMAQHGRVAYYQEQSIGKDDPGAVAGTYILQGFCDHVDGRA